MRRIPRERRRAVKTALLGALMAVAFFSAFSCIFPEDGPPGGQIIADHTVVGRFNAIPQRYIDIVKTWMVDAAGESHSEAYRSGIDQLAIDTPRLAAESFSGGFPARATPAVLRLGSHTSVGEGDFWTNPAAVSNIESLIAAQETAGNPINVIFQAWCWDLERHETNGPGGSGAVDPVYGCHWYGSTEGGASGNHHWGLDAADSALTGNSVSLQTYLDAMEEYRDFCALNGYDCVPVFTTGPVDENNTGGAEETGYQREVKHDAIRAFVRQDPDRVLFDYADILSYNEAGTVAQYTWNNGLITRTFKGIHPENLGGSGTGHIGMNGAVKLAKAMWWMLARLAGWDGR